MSQERYFGTHNERIGSICPECLGMVYRFCPACGIDMVRTGHGVYQRRDGTMPYPLTLCVDCIGALAARDGVHAWKSPGHN